MTARASGGPVAVGGDLSGTTANAQIVAGAVGSTEIASGAVGTGQLAGLAVVDGKVTTDPTKAISGAKITGVYRVLNPKDNAYAGGVKADSVYRWDAAMTSGSANLDLPGASSPPLAAGGFTAADVGKTVMVANAGAAGADLVTTIATYVSGTRVTLTSAAGSTVSAAEAIYGTDDTAAWVAVLAAVPGVGATITPPAGQASLVPNGGLACANPVEISGTAYPQLWTFGLSGSIIAMLATSGTLLRTTASGCKFSNLGLWHRSKGTVTRNSDLIGLDQQNGNFNRMSDSFIFGFSTGLKMDLGIGWTVSDTAIRDCVLRGVDARYTGQPDAGNFSLENVSIDRTSVDTATGGTAVYITSGGGAKLYLDINGKLGAYGFDYGVFFEVGDSQTSTAALRMTRGSIEGVKSAGVLIQHASGASNGQLWHPQIKNIEFNGLANSGVTGIIANGPILRTPDFSGNVFADFAHVMNLVQCQGYTIIGNSGHGIATDGITLGAGCVGGRYYANSFGGTLANGKEFVMADSGVTGAFDFWGGFGPEGTMQAPVGSTFRRANGGTSTSFYVKESIATALAQGWIAK